MRNTALLMAGGRGTRLWPVSRREKPKQFAALASEKPMLVETYERITDLVGPEGVFVIAEKELVELANPLFREVPDGNFITEPSARNSGPAALLGTLVIGERYGDDAVVAMLPADHTIPDSAAFAGAAARAYDAAGEPGTVVTFGIEPTRGDINYGYIEAGEPVDGGEPPVYAVRSFTEKPDEQTAKLYVAAGNFYWNSGMFFWRADTFADAWCALRPEEKDTVDEIAANVRKGETPTAYDKLDAISVDYAIMERYDPIVMVKGAFRWDDVGTFESLERIRTCDPDGNVTDGEVYVVGSSGNIILARGGRPAVVVGSEGLVVIDTGDVVLVYPKGEGTRVRDAVEVIEKERPDLS
ncbi:MAG: mannose-1-phosphate guanylyltransferase [Candidatus Coatesbacteria bacterium]|nr:MAG: mannose-1-phosphate guanylyltransferase [Candidatus Coatesbacteria bacterium]